MISYFESGVKIALGNVCVCMGAARRRETTDTVELVGGGEPVVTLPAPRATEGERV